MATDGRTYKIQDESRYDGLSYEDAIKLYNDEKLGIVPVKMMTMTWDELAAVNDPDVMETISTLAVGEPTVLGMCDPIERVS